MFNFEQTDILPVSKIAREGVAMKGVAMSCPSCASGRQAEFVAEVNLHFRGLENLDKPGILVFPKVLICMDCGFSQFSTSESELALLASGAAPTDTPIRRECPERRNGRGRLPFGPRFESVE